ncbi:MAG: hypothetical protein PUC21_07470 [Bacteroidales bacterium]|nr:hypothetical protein [Bacteroidales bacterium]MDY2930546.1 hypothetical protein [Muribaculaceae bacterium]MDD6132775.1 hypothetical protein [Bacteroidales bacterium]MDD6852103.1 hypothetical protein [Bacteroidales bacterium]MDY4882357.1 hypothetical protein [Muribaculaceae bacterium]
MNFYKSIFHIISSPKAAWEEVRKFSIPKDLLLSKTLYPMLAIIAVSVFAKYFSNNDLTLSELLSMSISDVCKYFFGYMISAGLLLSVYKITKKDEQNKLYVFIIFNYCILMFFNILINIIPIEIPILNLYPLYSVFIILKGFDYFSFPKSEEVKFVVLFSIIIILPSIVLEKLFNLLILTNG